MMMLFQQLLEAYDAKLKAAKERLGPVVSISDFTFKELENNKVLVSVKPTTGPLITMFRYTLTNIIYHDSARVHEGGDNGEYSASERANIKKLGSIVNAVENKNGGRINNLYLFKSNGYVLTFKEKPDLSVLRTYLEDYIKRYNESRERSLKALDGRKERKKESAKYSREMQKERKDELYSVYGKDVVDAVKIKPMSMEGDDGYQWAMFIDGRRVQSGMTKGQAEGEQRMAWKKLAGNKKWIYSLHDDPHSLDHAEKIIGKKKETDK
jgi:hypothetical protein